MHKRIPDAPAAEAAVREALQGQYGNALKGLSFRKCWYSNAGRQEFWDVEGTLTRRKGLMGRETRNFRYQVDPETGRVIGYELITPVPEAKK
ncbi:MAG: hypothetical protein A2147_08480 [Chloroflexi bacterium RBG_16_57_8]|nr:MAG: hypothetical protein A2147_08480 [Chloroflexi bacterium RBG_16_57_8]